MRKVLLLEPNYKNKYPPIGLMKLATYHRMLGDDVTFYKGDLKKFLLNEITNDCIGKLNEIEPDITWSNQFDYIFEFIKTGNLEKKNTLCSYSSSPTFIEQWLEYFRKFYKNELYYKFPQWDRVCISTLFTFHWDITIETIKFAKKLSKSNSEIWVGGVMASVLSNEIEAETGIKPWTGLLDKPFILDDNEIIIDNLPLDYSILHEIDYTYPESDGYYGYTTRGCTRTCDFCAVRILEKEFIHYCSLKDKIDATINNFGEKCNLLLLDNNVLASNRFPEIIAEIKACGFTNGAKFKEPDHMRLCFIKLEENYNDKAYVRAIYKLTRGLLQKLTGQPKQDFFEYLESHSLLQLEQLNKNKLLNCKNHLIDLYTKYMSKSSRLRYVDFNQGLDARLITDTNAQLLSEIPIKPLRIAFDSMKYEKTYTSAIKTAAKHGLKSFSNYLLYNFNDEPVELYQRLRLNIDLCEELNITIYSFPMKYHPINGKDHLNRNYLGKHWNRKYIRAVQVILNATKGKVGRGKSFFEKAFGKDENEFFKILAMPEVYILYRYFFEGNGFTQKWWESYSSLNNSEQEQLHTLIENNSFDKSNIANLKSAKLKNVLQHYLITRDDIHIEDNAYSVDLTNTIIS